MSFLYKRDKMSDAQVIEQVLNGDTGAFEILILKYQSQIFYSALNIVKNKEYAEDIWDITD